MLLLYFNAMEAIEKHYNVSILINYLYFYIVTNNVVFSTFTLQVIKPFDNHHLK